ncbi:hypothetical protein B0H13DRAFT_1991190 [Mycena leptocephala]|nr:hypothetical protein B0H13DRAFT_1991190 [Mycena leptocephala]
MTCWPACSTKRSDPQLRSLHTRPKFRTMSIRTTVLPRTIRRMASPALPLPRGTDAAPFPHRRRRLGHLPSTSGSGLDPLVSYQTLALLADLNRLLCTPHAGREFEFCGTCAITVGAGAKAPPSEAKLRKRTSKVVNSSRTAVVATQSAAIWMGGGTASDARRLPAGEARP